MTDVLSWLEQDAVVITATRRLRRELQERYARRQPDQQRAWPTPTVYFWDDWLDDLWHDLILADRLGERPPLVLDAVQEQHLWEAVIEASATRLSAGALMQIPQTARSARRSWSTLHGWDLRLAYLLPSAQPDVRAFAAWAEDFQRRCRRDNWLSRCEMVRYLAAAVGRDWRPQGPLVWVGFDGLNTAQAGLLEALQGAGVAVHVPSSPRAMGRVHCLACGDDRAELIAAASWARQLLLTSESASIGVVVPDLGQRRGEVEQVFDRILHPDCPWGSTAAVDRAFNISLGEPLARTPLVDTALVLLRLTGDCLLGDLSDLLHSPFVGGAERERGARAELERHLRRRGRERCSLAELRRWCDRASCCPRLLASLDQALAILPTLRGRHAPGVWLPRLSEWLQAFGWPGELTHSSAEQQTLEAWQHLLQRFAGLGAVMRPLSCASAIDRMTQLALEQMFQAQAPTVPVQILGLRETAGLQFEHLWISGMSDDVWPPAPRPDPFLPRQRQIERGYPFAHAEGVMAWCESISARWLGAAAEVVVSYPQRREEQSLRLSPLFASLSRTAGPDTETRTDPRRLQQLQRTRPVLETVPEDRPGAYTGSMPLPGGSAVFQDQSACPFRAFARHRLGAAALAEVAPGLDAARRGSIVHQCLAALWQELRSSERLAQLPAAALGELLAEQVGRVVTSFLPSREPGFERAFGALERARLQRLLDEWLDLERTRPPFTVTAVEQRYTVTVAGLAVSLRADRIDELASGDRLVLDYKTGRQAGVSQWSGERPEDPQLPLYLLTSEPPAAALGLAQVRRGGCGFAGLSGEPTDIAGIESPAEPDHWTRQLQEWRGVLERLAGAFLAGEAAVAPRDHNCCKYCDLPPLCRIHELTATREPDGD